MTRSGPMDEKERTDTNRSEEDHCNEGCSGADQDADNEEPGSQVPICPRCGNPMSWTGGELNCQIERYYCSRCWF
jgi:hypothetical protein